MPTVSVIIPTYNRSNLLREAIESVLRQTYTDFELVVIDDGSADDTRSVVKQFSSERIRYFYKDNGGQSSALNLGLIKAKGSYVAYLDEDDLWPPEYLKAMVGKLVANKDYGAAYTRVIELRADGTKREMSSPERYRSGWITRYYFDFSPCLMPSATCFRKSVWEGTFWDEALKRSPDYDVFLRISTKTQFLFVPNTFITKRSIPDSLSSKPNPLAIIDGVHALERFYFHLGGRRYAPVSAAKHKISHRYRKAAKISQASGNKHTAVLLFKKAISYYPMDVRLYVNLLRALLKTKKSETEPDWQMPEPLPPYVTVTQKDK